MQDKRKPIFVETTIQAPLEQVWDYTQRPDLHERWDLRFTNITYLPKEGDIQHFTYKTKIGLGMEISGEGQSRGTKHLPNGSSVSSLAFGTAQPLSLIKKGSGFWKYEPHEKGVTFWTQYDYDTRWGKLGAIIDRFIFRPLIGWATAWSFAALRQWLEKGTPPEVSFRRLVTNGLICLVLAFIWIYQGVVPKMLFPEAGELRLMQSTGFMTGWEREALWIIGWAEVCIGLLFLLPLRKYWLYLITSIALIGLGIVACVAEPSILQQPFNPLTLTAAMLVLSFIGAINERDMPTARHCKRSST